MSAMMQSCLCEAQHCTAVEIVTVCGVGADLLKSRISGSLNPWAHHRDLAFQLHEFSDVLSIGFFLLTILEEMMWSG